MRRLISPSLVFDLVLLALAGLVIALGSGVPQTVATWAAIMALFWVPYDLVTERRRT